MKRAVMAILVGALILASCSQSQESARALPHVEETSWGPIRVQLEIDPAAIEIHRDVLLTLRVSAPESVDITLPRLDDRFEGFTVSGSFEREPVSEGGAVQRQTQVRLTPIVAHRYRVAPIPVSYVDRSVSPPLNGWFPTGAITLELKSLVDGEPGDDIQDVLEPVWIHPSFKTVCLWLVLAVVILAALFGLWKLVTRVKEEVQLRRMSPRERALRELQRLLARDLIRQHLVKEFYVELTMIVRRYIERRHGVRAPEQTTEEFLDAVSQDTRFGQAVLERLRAFLEAADMVKFAGQSPDDAAIDHATETAKDYIESDSDHVSPDNQ